MKKAVNILVSIICLYALSFSAVQAKDISGLDINIERAFVHNHNGVTVVATITNNTGEDVKITETDAITGPLKGFKIHHENSYSMNGEVLKDGEANSNEVLLYFYDGVNAIGLEWIQPTFKVEIDGKTHNITGEKIGLQ